VKPKVLIISGRPTERESVCVLVGTMGCQWMVSSTVEDALANLQSERPLAAVLDLPDAVFDPLSMSQDFPKLLGQMQGRVVALTDETSAPEIADQEKKYSIPFVQRNRLMVDLWPCLATMFSNPVIRRITQVSRLVLDTFLQPLPQGIRACPMDMRQLVYEAGRITADICLEYSPDSKRVTASGQVMRSNEPRVPLDGVPVVIKGEKGPRELKLTNQHGEFSFEFEKERRVSFEIEVNHGHWVEIVSPDLEWGMAARAGRI